MKPSKNSSSGALSFFLAGAGTGFLFWSQRRRMRQMRRIDFRGKSVLISGGSRGLGLELARQLSREGAKLALLARSADELERAREMLTEMGADVLTLPCDVSLRQEVEEAVAAILDFRGGIDVLINNAGIIQVAPFENLDLHDYEDSVNVHAWGPLHLIRAVAPHMQRRRTGRIVNISSIGGLVAVPHLLAYTMGKFALTGLSDGFRAELAKDNIFVTTVAPGLMRTGSHINAFFKGQYRKEFAWFAVSGANPLLSTSAPRAARKIIEACRYGEAAHHHPSRTRPAHAQRAAAGSNGLRCRHGCPPAPLPRRTRQHRPYGTGEQLRRSSVNPHQTERPGHQAEQRRGKQLASARHLELCPFTAPAAERASHRGSIPLSSCHF